MGKATGRHKDKRLSAADVRSLKRGFHADGHGLYLKVEPNDARRWIQRITIGKKRRDIGLGSPPRVSLKEAREKALDNLRIARAGGDPTAKPAAVPTFEVAARACLAELAPTWTGPRQSAIWWRSMEAYIFPALGSRPVDEISAQAVRAVLEPVWTSKPETARKLVRRVQAVFRHALGRGYIREDPSAGVTNTLPRHTDRAAHHAALPYAEVGAAVEKIRATQAWAGTKLAFEFLVLTAARSGEVRGARVSRELPHVGRRGDVAPEGDHRARPRACACKPGRGRVSPGRSPAVET
ncbi:DUF4102 domain-containing protein [Rhodobacteraceae bacterium DSL-40]|uniref:tyrosine-type recombinase/integrase n=1 Tax=Amaricoccus sp. B4 TaxID=3368557 RepID=UPI0013A70260